MRFGVRRGAVIAHAIRWKERDGQERFREFRDRPRELEAGVLSIYPQTRDLFIVFPGPVRQPAR